MSIPTNPVSIDAEITAQERESALADAISQAWEAQDATREAEAPVEEVPEETPDEFVPEAAPDAADDDESGEEPAQPDTEPEPLPDTVTVGGRTFDADQAKRLLDLYDWATEMDPRTADQIGALLSGEFELAPRGAAAPPPPPQAPEPPPDPLAQIDLDMVDPAVVAILRAQQAELAAIRETTQYAAQQSEQALHAQAKTQFQAAADRVMSNTAEKYGFDEDEVAALARAGAQYVDRFAPGYDNPDELFDAVLEHTLWTTPKFRDMALNNVATSRASEEVQKHASKSAEIADKAARGSSVSNPSGSIPRSAPAPRNMTRAERAAAMTSDIAASISGP